MRKLTEKGILVNIMKKGLIKPLFFMTLLFASLLMIGCTEDNGFEAPSDFDNLNITLSFNNNRLYSGYLLETTLTDGEVQVAKMIKSLYFNQNVFELYQMDERLNVLLGDDEFITEEKTEYYTLTEHYYHDEGIWVKEEGNFKQNKNFSLKVEHDMFEEGFNFKQDRNMVVFTGILKTDKVVNFIPGYELTQAKDVNVEITYNNNARQLHLLTLSYVNETNKIVNLSLKVSYKLHRITLPTVE